MDPKIEKVMKLCLTLEQWKMVERLERIHNLSTEELLALLVGYALNCYRIVPVELLGELK